MEWDRIKDQTDSQQIRPDDIKRNEKVKINFYWNKKNEIISIIIITILQI